MSHRADPGEAAEMNTSHVTGEETVAAGTGTVSVHRSLYSRADKCFATIEDWLNNIGVIFVMLLAVLVVAEVIGRYLFKRPIRGYIDIMEMMMVVLVFSSIAICQREDGHIRIETFMTRVLKAGRPYQVMEFLYLLLALLGFAIIATFSLKSAMHAYSIGDVSLTAFWPTWPSRMALSLGAVLLCIRFILQMFQLLTGTGMKTVVPHKE